MWKSALFASSLSVMLLTGCNWNNDANEAGRGVEDAVHDTSETIKDTVDPDRTTPNGTNGINGTNGTNGTNEPGINNNGTVPSGTVVPEVNNGTTVPNTNQEGVIIDEEVKKKNNVNTP